jgi:sarcosine oxidase, subunit beta
MVPSINYADDLPRRAGLVVIGGGVVGAATAFFARRAGLSPLLIEKRPALCTLTTPASTGAFRLQFDNHEELEMVRESVDLFLNFADATAQAEYDLRIRQQGYLWVTTDDQRAERQRHLVEKQHEWGQTDVEVLSGEDVRQRWPWITREVVQARWRPGDGFLDPKALTMGLAAGAHAEVLVDCEAMGFRIRGDRVVGVETSRGTVECDAAVIACGPFSGLVAAAAGIELPIETLQRQKIIMPDVPLVPPDAPMTIDDDTGAHWRPALRGAYLLFTDPETRPSPPSENVPPDHRHAFRLLEPDSPTSVARIVPFWREVWDRNEVVWLIHAGQYTMTPDHRPLLGHTPIEGLFLNTGYSGHGIMGSPAGSRHLVEVMVGVIDPSDNKFAPDRSFEPRDLDVL